jgi:hypothetical protein
MTTWTLQDDKPISNDDAKRIHDSAEYAYESISMYPRPEDLLLLPDDVCDGCPASDCAYCNRRIVAYGYGKDDGSGYYDDTDDTPLGLSWVEFPQAFGDVEDYDVYKAAVDEDETLRPAFDKADEKLRQYMDWE